MGRDDESYKLLYSLHGMDASAEHCYLRYLADSSRYDELISAANSPQLPYVPPRAELYGWMFDQALHNQDWLRVRTTGRERTRLLIREGRLMDEEFYSEPYNLRARESALIAFLNDLGPQRLADTPLDYTFESDSTRFLTAGDQWNSYDIYTLCVDDLVGPLTTLYGTTGDSRWLEPVLGFWPLPQKLEELEESYGYSGYSDIGGRLARAYVLRGEYDKAGKVIAQWRDPNEPTSGQSAVLLLVQLASGKDLRTDPIMIADLSSGESVAGPLHALREGDTLVMTLRSPQFAAALQHSGRTLADVLPEIRAATQPQRDAYYDSANGGVDAIRRQLHLSKL
jgi:hypothetical protein